MSKVRLRDIKKSFGERTLFENVDIIFPDCGFVSLVGDSGSGKSTLLDMIAGIDVDYEGEITVNGISIKKLDEEKRSTFRLSHLGFLRQHYDLLELETALDNVMFPLLGEKKRRKMLKRKALDLLRSFNLYEKRDRIVSTLSGGEKQRVALARALINESGLLLCDEPTGALDKENAEMVFSYLRSLSERILVILVTHDEESAKKYSDVILRLKNGRITGSLVSHASAKSLPVVSVRSNPDPDEHVPLYCWIPHGLHLLKAKKWRSLLSSMIVTFSLLALGLSLYVQRDLKGELNSVFTSLTGESLVVMERSEGVNTYTNVYASTESSIKDMMVDYPSLIRDYGLSYLADFSSYFPDSEVASITSQGKFYQIPNLGIRNINDFLWLDTESERTYYPSCPAVLEKDHVVLGLPYSAMVNVCLTLGILRNYETLGDYLSSEPLYLLFRFQNDDWTYYDEQILTVSAVTETSSPTLFHYEHKWNEYILEERMCFPYSEVDDDSLPWILQKVFFIVPRTTKTEFVENSRKYRYFDRYIFERPSYEYNATQCIKGQASSLNRLYVYEGNKRVLASKDISSISTLSGISSYAVYGEGQYMHYADAMAVGFVNNFFLSNALNPLIEATDAYAICRIEDSDKGVELPEGVYVGSIMKPRSASITLSSNFSRLSSGVMPSGNEEICLSTSLYNKLGAPSSVHFSAMASSFTSGDYLHRDYRYGEVKVTGVVEESSDVMYVSPYWTIDYFRDILGISAFLLEGTQAVFYLNEGSSSKEIIEYLKMNYPDYQFTDPSSKASESISTVVTYVDIILRIASILALVSSAFLLIVVSLLNVLENRREAKMMFLLGIKRDDIVDCYGTSLLIIITYSSLLASTILAFLEKVVDETIKGNFGGGGSFTLDLIPIMAIILSGFVGFALVYLLTRRYIKRRNFSQRE